MGSKSLIRSRWAAIGAAVAVTLGGGGLIGVSAASGDASSLKTTTPTRIMDTRQGSDGKVSGETVALQVTGEVTTYAANGTTPAATVVPAGANAVAVNLTVTEGERNQGYGFVTAFPCTAATDTVPNASTLNFVEGTDVANSTVVPLGTTGKMCLNVYGSAHVIVDVSGYYETATATAAALNEKLDKSVFDEGYYQKGRTKNTNISPFDWQLGTSFCAGGTPATCKLSYPDGGLPYFTLDNGTGTNVAYQAEFYVPLFFEEASNNFDMYYLELCYKDPSGTTFRAPEIDSVTMYYQEYESAEWKPKSVALTPLTATLPGHTTDDDKNTCVGFTPPTSYDYTTSKQAFSMAVMMSDNGAVTNENRMNITGGTVTWYNQTLWAESGG